MTQYPVWFCKSSRPCCRSPSPGGQGGQHEVEHGGRHEGGQGLAALVADHLHQVDKVANTKVDTVADMKVGKV